MEVARNLKTESKKLRVALVWPKGFTPLMVLPIALGYLKSNSESDDFEINIIDCTLSDFDSESEQFKNEIMELDPHLVAVSSWSPMYMEALAVLKKSKSLNPSIITIIGGAHASAYSDRVIEEDCVDYLIRGEGDLSFKIFLQELKSGNCDWSKPAGLMYKNKYGKVIKNEMERTNDLDQIKMPDWEAVQLDKYIKLGYRYWSPVKKNAPIWVTRGCPYRCQYCAAPFLNGKPVRKHSVKYMLDAIQDLYYRKGIRWFNIIDDNFTFHVKYAKEFCRAIIDLNLKGIGFGTPNGIRLQRGDPELWKLMKRAGWRVLSIAPESGSKNTLALMKKDLDLEIVPEVVNDIRNAGIKVRAFFMLGYPGETREDIEKTTALIKKCRFSFAAIANFNPLPGTPVYDELIEKGEIKDGTLPGSFMDDYLKGARVYTPKELKDFDFQKYRLKILISMALRDPSVILYLLQNNNPVYMAKLMVSYIWNMFTAFVKECLSKFLESPKYL